MDKRPKYSHREIRFRGFQEMKEGGPQVAYYNGAWHSGAWREGSYARATSHWNDNGKHEDWIITSAIQNGGYFNTIGRFAVVPETLCQFTGMVDRNNFPIFEGDIVVDDRYKIPMMVAWNPDDCGFWLYRDDTYYDHPSQNCGILGHVFQGAAKWR